MAKPSTNIAVYSNLNKYLHMSNNQDTTKGISNYGVLRGIVVEHGREDNDPESPHLQIIVEAKGQRWRCAVNVLSTEKNKTPDEREVLFAIIDPLVGHPILDRLHDLSEGFTPLPDHKPGLTLDFVREPLFAPKDIKHLPPSGPAVGDDLQDLLEVYVNKAEGKSASVAEVFVWGAKFAGGQRPADKQFKTKQGVHEIHMNQGNPKGPHFGDNGVFQDGGLIFRFSNPAQYVGIFLKFDSQSFQTNDRTGTPLTGADQPKPIPPDKQPLPGARSPVAIVAAVVNPDGEEIGNETVTLLNTLSEAVNLTGWAIEDRDGNRDLIDGQQLRAGESKVIVLSGQGARLSNKGGAITLRDPDGMRVHSVTYSKKDAAEQGRTILF